MSYTMEGMFSSFLRQLKPTLEQLYSKFLTQEAYLRTSIWRTFNSRSFLIKNTFMNTALFSDLEAFVVLFHQQMLSLQIGEADPGCRSFTKCSADKFLTRFALFRDRVTYISLHIGGNKEKRLFKKIPLVFCTFGRVCWLLLIGVKLFLSLILFALQFVNVSVSC